MHNSESTTTATQRTPVEPSGRQQSSLLTPKDVAALLGLKTSTLAKWRITGSTVLPYVQIGARTRYRRSDVDAFIEANVRTTTSDRGPAR